MPSISYIEAMSYMDWIIPNGIEVDQNGPKFLNKTE